MPSSLLHSLNGYINNYKNVLILPVDLSNLKYLLSGPIRKKIQSLVYTPETTRYCKCPHHPSKPQPLAATNLPSLSIDLLTLVIMYVIIIKIYTYKKDITPILCGFLCESLTWHHGPLVHLCCIMSPC